MTISYSEARQIVEWTKNTKDVGGLVDGIGDAAYWGSAGEDPPSVIGFRQGGRSVRILVMAVGARTIDRPKLEEMAKLISARMPR